MGERHAQCTKEIFKADIESSINQKTIYKIFEYLDDYSYSSSEKIGIYVRMNKDLYELFLFQEDGPKTEKDMIKLMKWRHSGESKEVGHKGGGNKRLLYGLNADKFTICMNLGDDKIINSNANPNKILEYSSEDITEQEFRSNIDTNIYIGWPNTIDIDEMSGWYSKIYEKIANESNISPNYMIKVVLSKLPDEFIKESKWNEFINQIRAKQYNIPIYFKNEILGMKSYETYENIDLVGINYKENEKCVGLYVNECNIENNFYLFNDGKYYDLNSSSEVLDDISGLKHWGDIDMYTINKNYFDTELKKYNEGIIEQTDKKKGEDFHGIYFLLNGKFTNYIPSDETSLPDGKNNKILEGGKSTNLFRIIIRPNNEICNDNNIFNMLIRTETIKALSGFLDKSPHKMIIKKCMDIYRGVDITNRKSRTKKSPKPKEPNSDTVYGMGYLIKFPKDLWKFGIVKDIRRFDSRMNEHKNDCIDKVKLFTQETITNPSSVIYYKSEKIKNQGSWEDFVKNILEEYNNAEKIKLYESRNGEDTREYFSCTDDDLITQEIILRIKEYSE